MKKFLILALGAMIFASCSNVQEASKNATGGLEQYRYDIEYVKNAGDGMSLVRVWSYGKPERAAEERCKANAVHGVIFKGYSGDGSVQPALVRSATGYEDNKEFFDKFFQNGDYLRYISSTVEGSTEVRKLKGGEYKASMTITVNVKQLRAALTQAGVIRGLATGF